MVEREFLTAGAKPVIAAFEACEKGYLSLIRNEYVIIDYVGVGHSDEGWLFGHKEKNSAERGWFPLSAIVGEPPLSSTSVPLGGVPGLPVERTPSAGGVGQCSDGEPDVPDVHSSVEEVLLEGKAVASCGSCDGGLWVSDVEMRGGMLLASEKDVCAWVTRGTKGDCWEQARQDELKICRSKHDVAREEEMNHELYYTYVAVSLGALYGKYNGCWYQTTDRHHISICYLPCRGIWQRARLRDVIDDVIQKWKFYIGMSLKRASWVTPCKYIRIGASATEDEKEVRILQLELEERRGVAVERISMVSLNSGSVDEEFIKARSWVRSNERVEKRCRDPLGSSTGERPFFVDVSQNAAGRVSDVAQIRTLLHYIDGVVSCFGCKHWYPLDEGYFLGSSTWHISLCEHQWVNPVEDPWIIEYLEDAVERLQAFR